MTTQAVASMKKRKDYFRHLTDGKSLRELAEKVKRPDGETVDQWMRKFSSIRGKTLSTVTPASAPYFAPVLGVTVEALLNPPKDFTRPTAGATRPAAARLSLSDLKRERGFALDKWMSDRDLSATALAKELSGDDEDVAAELAVDIGDWRNGKKLFPAKTAQLWCETLGGDSFQLIVQYTDEEMAELGTTSPVPPPADDDDDGEPEESPAPAARKRRKKRGRSVSDDTEVPRAKRKYTRRAPPQAVETAPPPTEAPAASAAATPKKRMMRFDNGDLQALFEGGEQAEVIRKFGKRVVVRVEREMSEDEFLNLFLPKADA